MEHQKNTSDLFSGQSRVEFCAPLGRPIRKGNPAELAVSDFRKIKDALENKDPQNAKLYLNSVHPMYLAMNATFLEWCIALPQYLSKKHGLKELDITRESYALFIESISKDKEKNKSGAAKALRQILHPKTLTPYSIDAFRIKQKNKTPNEAHSFLEGPIQKFELLSMMIGNENFSDALMLFDDYFREMRISHDLCGEYVSAYASTTQHYFGQKVASEVAQQGLESCALLQGYWDLVASLDAQTLAAFMAEHLRGHFSGENREGSVRVVEDEEKYRLIFDPCGTGGALRQAKALSLQNYREASAETWNLKDTVPSYCSHCAKNELTSISKLGYPAWVTEFNPDATKPCGWTFYKDPKDIPEKYFERLGLKKDETKFKK